MQPLIWSCSFPTSRHLWKGSLYLFVPRFNLQFISFTPCFVGKNQLAFARAKSGVTPFTKIAAIFVARFFYDRRMFCWQGIGVHKFVVSTRCQWCKVCKNGSLNAKKLHWDQDGAVSYGIQYGMYNCLHWIVVVKNSKEMMNTTGFWKMTWKPPGWEEAVVSWHSFVGNNGCFNGTCHPIFLGPNPIPAPCQRASCSTGDSENTSMLCEACSVL